MKFDIKETAIFQALEWEGFYKLIGVLKRLFLLSSFLLLFSLFFWKSLFPLFGLFLVFPNLYLIAQIEESFFNLKLKNPKLKNSIGEALTNPDEINLADFFSFETAKAIWKSKNNSDKLFYNILYYNPRVNFIFSRLLIDVNKIKRTLKSQKAEDQSDNFKEIIIGSLRLANQKKHERVELGDIIISLAKNNLTFKTILVDVDLNVSDIESTVLWLETLERRIMEERHFWEWENLIKKGSLAKDWAAGYSPLLDRFGIDYSAAIKQQGFAEIIGHKEEIEAMERVLARRELNNCVLVGEPETGKKSMVLELARKSALGKSFPEINYKRIIQLDLSSLVAQTKDVEEAEAFLEQIFGEIMHAGNIILVIDNFHHFIGGEKRPGIIDISGVIIPYLPLPGFQVIAITSFEGLHERLEQKQSILSLFEKVEVKEISGEETLMILEDHSLLLENRYKKYITFTALKETINLAEKYISKPFPKSAISLLDEAIVYVSSLKEKLVRPEHIRKIVSEKIEIPIGEVEEKEKGILLNLEELIHQRIVNQEEGVREISVALRRARAEISDQKGPMGTFLFLGPTGVGKTETAKALASIYFGSEEKMIRLDMSEFQSVSDIPRLIGSPGEEGLLTTEVKENPFSLILLDEIEKAHPNILNLFLQVLDEGHLTDGSGNRINFKNSIIIATSNAGYQIILEAIKENSQWPNVKQKLLDYFFKEGIFRPEFINRFDAMVVFKPLSRENILMVAEMMLKKIEENLKEKNIDLIITHALKQKIAELGYDPTFGARQMKRVIQNKIEDVLATAILSGEIKRKDMIEINPETFKIRKL
ncbi:MAG: ATP-dependent Clp protease ATP-binding subunit [Candidatus Nealsonbacteria bacterium]|nr:ATP-dependent Clp protease ATP-binding subunit [Candidatus Nealsonbacteria bacterium]